MHYIVCPLRPDAMPSGIGNSLSINDKEALKLLKIFDTDEHEALRRAEELAKKNPGVQYAVFAPVRIAETLTPTVVHKKLNENGEIVLDKGGQ